MTRRIVLVSRRVLPGVGRAQTKARNWGSRESSASDHPGVSQTPGTSNPEDQDFNNTFQPSRFVKQKPLCHGKQRHQFPLYYPPCKERQKSRVGKWGRFPRSSHHGASGTWSCCPFMYLLYSYVCMDKLAVSQLGGWGSPHQDSRTATGSSGPTLGMVPPARVDKCQCVNPSGFMLNWVSQTKCKSFIEGPNVILLLKHGVCLFRSFSDQIELIFKCL